MGQGLGQSHQEVTVRIRLSRFVSGAVSLSVTARGTMSQRAEVPPTAPWVGVAVGWHLRNESVHAPEGLVGLMRRWTDRYPPGRADTYPARPCRRPER